MDPREPDLRQLARRIDRLEHLVVQLLGGAASLALALGSVLAYLPVAEGSDEEDVAPRLLTAGFHAIAYRDSGGDRDGFSIAAGIGFLGLVVVAAVAVWLMVVIGTGSATERTARWLKVDLVLLVIGTVVAGLFALVGLGSDEVAAGPGILWFAGGVTLCLLMNSQGLRRWWDPVVR